MIQLLNHFRRGRIIAIPRWNFSNVNMHLDWPGKYRELINDAMLMIKNNDQFHEIVKTKYIIPSSWDQYLYLARRRLVTRPIEYFGSDFFAEFKSKLDYLLASAESDKSMDDIVTREKLQLQILEKPQLNNEFCNYLFTKILKSAEDELKDEISSYEELSITSDLRIPHEWCSLIFIYHTYSSR